MIKMVAFDMDATIVDTYKFFMRAFTGALQPFHDAELSIKEIENGFGLNELGMIKTILKSHHNEALDEYHRLYELYHDKVAEPFEGIKELISYLRDNNIKVALITGKGATACDISLKKLDMENIFCDVLTGNENCIDKSGAIDSLLSKHGLTNDEFLYIGDAVSDVSESKKSGVICLSACWADNVDVARLKEVNPNYIFSTVEGLRAYLSSIMTF